MMIQLFVSALCNACMAVALYEVNKRTQFKNFKEKRKQMIYGLCFGGLAIYASTSFGGVDLGYVILNVRDSAPLCAGLIFGGPAGIIAGGIGGIYRYFATLWWHTGAYTQIACSVSTILIGFIAYALRKTMFDDKKPTWIFGIGITVICEIIHMMMIFLTNMNDPATAFYYVRAASLPMILANAVAVGLALLGIRMVTGEKRERNKGKRHIVQAFQFWLFICILIAFTVTGIFTSTIQSGISEKETEEIIQTHIQDVYEEIYEASGEAMETEFIAKLTKHRHIGKQGFMVVCDNTLNILTEGMKASGENIQMLGIETEIKDVGEQDIFEVTFHGERYLCTYRLAGDYYIIGLMPVSEAMYMKSVSTYTYLFMELIVFAALFVLIYFLVKKLVLDNLMKVNAKLAEITNGNLEVVVDVRSNEEFASLSDDINATVEVLKQYIADAAARIDEELDFAKQIQYASLPPAFSSKEYFDIYASMDTAKEVGGDFYDYYMLGDSKFVFLTADVSGKGIPAAMFMMRAKTTIKDLAEQGLEPNTIFTMANEKLCENNEAMMFVTAWLGILDLKTGILQYVNAGHNPPLLYRKKQGYVFLREKSGLPLAAMEGVCYRKYMLTLDPGEVIYLYTDGVTEAINVDGVLYGEKRLCTLLNDATGVSSEALCQAVKASVDAFANDAVCCDDMTMLALTFYAAVDENRIRTLPKEGCMSAMNLFVDRLIAKLEIVPKVSNRIRIIFDELYSNIVFYSKASIAEISYRIEDGKIYLKFEDDGIPYNPLAAKAPDIRLDADERELGGLGILMVKKMTDSMVYHYENDKNILELTISLRG